MAASLLSVGLTPWSFCWNLVSNRSVSASLWDKCLEPRVSHMDQRTTNFASLDCAPRGAYLSRCCARKAAAGDSFTVLDDVTIGASLSPRSSRLRRLIAYKAEIVLNQLEANIVGGP